MDYMTRYLRYASAMSAAILLLGFWLAGGEARVQATEPAPGTPSGATTTPVPSPTVTATPSVPSGQDLLTQMSTAMVAKNTYHGTYRSVTEVPAVQRQVENLQADVSIKPALEREVGTIRLTQLNRQPTKSTTQRERVILVKKRLATKTGKKAWACTTVSQVAQTVGSVHGATKIESLTTLGPETVSAISVWHVREVATVSILGQSVPVTADFYISQADFTMVRATISDSLTISGITATANVVQDFSKYGEKVKVKLPAACKGKSAAANLRTSAILHPLDNPADLAGSLETMARDLTHEVRSGS